MSSPSTRSTQTQTHGCPLAQPLRHADIDSKKHVPASASHDGVVVCLYRPRMASNVGAILRTVACSGFSRVIVISAEPGWKFPWMTSEHAQSALRNASKGVDIEIQYLSTAEFLAMSEPGSSARPIVCLETADRAVSLHEYEFPREAAGGCYLLFGSEGMGVSDERLLSAATDVVCIPMFGYHSLNLSASVAMTLYELRRQWGT